MKTLPPDQSDGTTPPAAHPRWLVGGGGHLKSQMASRFESPAQVLSNKSLRREFDRIIENFLLDRTNFAEMVALREFDFVWSHRLFVANRSAARRVKL